ncbi:MAG: DEAD/DEAH box helicase [Clostridia bacterium]|nr:DEAD/DEAH box helicase [Clostridia bacterium]
MSNNLKISFAKGAFNKQHERGEFGETRKFTKKVAEMNKAAEVLDRDDEFDKLSLHSSDYAKNDESEYGIPERRFHHGSRDRLLPRQMKAAHRFLKELRGFGLLADVVGSGKTYEACAVLSELSAKGKITSALLIVPSQVYQTWIDVLEMSFGLGKGVLNHITEIRDSDLVTDGAFRRPKSPMIVTAEDFAKWNEHSIKNVLFDVVIVDEAHHLCGEEGHEAKSMKLLSLLMQTKKAAKKTYCVLLSATPHSGSLENMFRLWYFVRCKGGNPTDFDEKDDVARTAEYREEKEYYRTVVCRGAATVSEFIENVRMDEVTITFRHEFSAFLAKQKIRSMDAFHKLLISEKKRLIREFLDLNPEIKEKVNDNIASAYHDGVLRSIMIRQPGKDDNEVLLKGKRIENILFFDAKKTATSVRCNGLNGKQITVHFDKIDEAGAIEAEDGSYSLAEYIMAHQGNQTYRDAYAELFFAKGGILQEYGLGENSFDKPDSFSFYYSLMRRTKVTPPTSNDGIGFHFSPVAKGNMLDAKMAELKSILRKNKNNRVLIFFDYDIARSERCYEQVLTELRKDKEFSERVLIGGESDKAGKDQKIKLFDQKEDAVLVVTNSAFTEGANLQKCNVIVNFQVTPSPLAMEQRIGRIFRLGQENDVTVYSLADMRALEGYVLMYFTHIGLMTSNSGDAAIIAGCNNDNMVTIRCKACERVRLLSREEYVEKQLRNPEDLYCAENAECTQLDPKGTLMEEINSHEMKCTGCGKVIKREGDNRYYCFSSTDDGSHGVLCNTGERGDRKLYCRKICVISHCKRFTSGPLKDKCAALKYYKSTPNASEAYLETLCNDCPSRSICPDRCHLVPSSGIEDKAILHCLSCEDSSCVHPKPHVIEFADDKWIATCPDCKSAIKPVVARTFETYIRSAYSYQQDGGKAFCPNLLNEADKVSNIQNILSNDRERR